MTVLEYECENFKYSEDFVTEFYSGIDFSFSLLSFSVIQIWIWIKQGISVTFSQEETSTGE